VDSSIATQLGEYYLLRGIHPQNFNCQHQEFCRSFANQNDMTEAKMSMVGSRYGAGYPKIVVVSSDPPLGNKGAFVQPHQRTTKYITDAHETDDYTSKHPNPHWAMTHIIVKDLLCLFGYKPQVRSAVVEESYAGRPIENVAPYFAHVNVAKCSMNHPDKGQADRKVHKCCSDSYLMEEVTILQPDILITQGTATNEILGSLLTSSPFSNGDLPAAQYVNTGNKSTLWLPMHHPPRQLHKIREDWPFYVRAVQEWKHSQK